MNTLSLSTCNENGSQDKITSAAIYEASAILRQLAVIRNWFGWECAIASMLQVMKSPQSLYRVVLMVIFAALEPDVKQNLGKLNFENLANILKWTMLGDFWSEGFDNASPPKRLWQVLNSLVSFLWLGGSFEGRSIISALDKYFATGPVVDLLRKNLRQFEITRKSFEARGAPIVVQLKGGKEVEYVNGELKETRVRVKKKSGSKDVSFEKDIYPISEEEKSAVRRHLEYDAMMREWQISIAKAGEFIAQLAIESFESTGTFDAVEPRFFEKYSLPLLVTVENDNFFVMSEDVLADADIFPLSFQRIGQNFVFQQAITQVPKDKKPFVDPTISCVVMHKFHVADAIFSDVYRSSFDKYGSDHVQKICSNSNIFLLNCEL